MNKKMGKLIDITRMGRLLEIAESEKLRNLRFTMTAPNANPFPDNFNAPEPYVGPYTNKKTQTDILQE